MSAKVRVLLVEHHTMLRAGLRKLIDAEPDMVVVGEAGEGPEAWRLVEQTRPDVVVMGLDLPGTDPAQLIRRIADRHPPTRVLVLTSHDEVQHLRSSLDAGAVGFLVKTAGEAELLSAIRAVHGGRTVVDANLRSILGPSGPRSPPSARERLLTEREKKVLGLLAAGLSYEEVARRLSVTPKTVETYRTRLGRKLGIQSRAELVSYALHHGLLKDSSPAE